MRKKIIVITDITDLVIFKKVMDKIKLPLPTDRTIEQTFEGLKANAKSDLRFGVVIKPDNVVYLSYSAYYLNFNEADFGKVHFMDVLELGLNESISKAEKLLELSKSCKEDEKSQKETELKAKKYPLKINITKEAQEIIEFATNKPKKKGKVNLKTPIIEKLKKYTDITEKKLRLKTIKSLQTMLDDFVSQPTEEEIKRSKLMNELNELGAKVVGLDYSGMSLEQLLKIVMTAKGN